MASLNRKFLSALGIDEEKAEQIFEMHQSVLAEIKTERDEFKDKASKSDSIQKELDEAKKQIESMGTDVYKDKYDALKAEYDGFKADQEAKALVSKKDKAYRNLLKEAGVSEKHIDKIMKITSLDEIELEGESLKDSDSIMTKVKDDWSDFIVTAKAEGAATTTPPAAGETKGINEIPIIF